MARRSRGQSLINYALIFAIVTAALVGMTTYIKRGVQGKVRDMTDFFINDGQIVELDPTTSLAESTSTGSIDKKEFSGGKMQLGYLGTKSQQAKSVVEESDSFGTQLLGSQFFGHFDGHIETPEQPDEGCGCGCE